MNTLNKREQDKLIEFVRFFRSYNPDFRMAPIMQTNFKMLRDECNLIADKLNQPDY